MQLLNLHKTKTMIKKILITGTYLFASVFCFAQKSDGTTKSLVNADKAFAEKAIKSGIKTAYLDVSIENTLVFRPNPVNAKTYYASQPNTKNLSWKPSFAKVSKSGDWGFTSGAYEINDTKKEYGQYLSIWKARNGKWELALDLGIEHNKPLIPVKEEFIEPNGKYTPKLFSTKDAAVGMEIIYDTERTLNTSLKSFGIAALGGFLNNDARLLFTGNEPIIGKTNIMSFTANMVENINFKNVGASKANGGELAYTYGVATFDYKGGDLRESFNYVFIWERQADHNWNIILQIYAPAER